MPENKQGAWITWVLAIVAVIAIVLSIIAWSQPAKIETKEVSKTCKDLGCSIGACNLNTGVCETAVPGPVQYVDRNVTVEVVKDYVGQAKEDFMDAVNDEDSLQECNGTPYDFDQISVSKVYKSYSVEYQDSNKDKYTVNFEIKLKYQDKDAEEHACYQIFNPSVFYEPTEDPVVSW